MTTPERQNRRSSGRGSRFFSTIITGYGVIIASVLVNLWLTPFVLRFISREEYAVWVLTLDVIAWLAVLDLGFKASLAVTLARLEKGGREDEMSTLASTTFVAQAIMGLVAIALGVLASRWLPAFFNVPDEFQADAALVILSVVAGFGLSMPSHTFSAIIVSFQRGPVDNMILGANFVVRIVLAVIFLEQGMGLRSLAVAHVAASLTSAALLWLASRRIAPAVRIRVVLASRASLQRLTDVGIWITVANLSTIAVRGLDRLVASRYVSLASVAVLELTARAYQPGMTATGQFVKSSTPFLGEIFGEGDRDRSFSIFRRLFLATASATCLVAAALFSANGAFVVWWVGEANYGGIALDAFLAINTILFFTTWSHKNALTALLITRPVALIRIAEAVLNLTISILLAGPFGITGIIAGSTFASLATSGWAFPRWAARELGVPMRTWIARVAMPLVLPTIGVAILALLARQVAGSVGGPIGAIAAAALVLTLGAPVYWVVALDTETRKDVVALIRARIARRRPER